MRWTTWVAEREVGDMLCFCPVEFTPEGGVVVVTGMNHIAPLDEFVKTDGVKRVYKVSSVYDLSDAEMVYDCDENERGESEC